MPKSSYYWSREQEKKLIDLWTQGERNVTVLAAQVGRKPEAVRKKLERMGLVVGQKKNFSGTTTNKEEEETRVELEIPPELPSVEEALKLMAAAMHALSKPGLSKVEILRFRTIVNAVKTYQKLLAEYINYREIEEKLVDLEAKYVRWLREKQERSKQLNVEARALRRVWPNVMVKRKATFSLKKDKRR